MPDYLEFDPAMIEKRQVYRLLTGAVCKLERILELGPNRHPLVIGEVVYIHVDPACMTNGYIDMKKLNPIGRLNGFFYATLGKIFERPFFDGQSR